MRKAQEFIIKGMNRDLSVSKFTPEFAYENMNLRITALNGNTLLSVTNEIGNTELTISGDPLVGECIGRQVLDRYLVLFTVDGDTSRIYRLLYDGTSFESLLLYKGNLGFRREAPIECIGIVETQAVQKVYWIDGIHQLRSVNIVSDGEERSFWTDTSFDSIQELALKEEVSVTKSVGIGIFPSGTIQYAATYFNKNGQQSNIFYISPLFYISGTDRGLSPEESSGNSFSINIRNTDPKFGYIRVYSIMRTSEDGTPIVRIVSDIDISKASVLENGLETGSITFISNTGTLAYSLNNGDMESIPDGSSIPLSMSVGSELSLIRELYSPETGTSNSLSVRVTEDTTLTMSNTGGRLTLSVASGNMVIKSGSGNSVTCIDTNTGTSIDPTELLYVGGEDIIAGAITHKDNTLFLGNLRLNTPVVPDDVKFSLRGTKLSLKDKTLTPFQPDGSSTGYDYLSSLSGSLDEITTFMDKEYYRFGVRFQHKTGRFSEVIYLSDLQINKAPDITSSSGSITITGNTPYAVIPSSVQKRMMDKGYVRVQGVVVFPSQNERRVVCQGMLQPTVFNVGNRLGGGDPYAQAGWRMRFIRTEPVVHDLIYPSADTYKGNTGWMGEIQSDIWYLEPILSKSTYNLEKKRNRNTNKYFVDNSILTLESPDLTFDDKIQSLDLSGLTLRIVGVAEFTASVPDYTVTLSKNAYRPDGGIRKVPPASNKYLNGNIFRFNNWPVYVDKYTSNTSNSDYEDADALFPLYMWHRAGSINNSKSLEDDPQGFGILDKKIFTQLYYSNTTIYLQNSVKSVRTSDIKLFNSDEVTATRLVREIGGPVTYYGNVNTIVPPPPYHPYDTDSGDQDGFEWDSESNYQIPGYFLTYVVRTHEIEYNIPGFPNPEGHGPITESDFQDWNRKIIGSSSVTPTTSVNRSGDTLQHVKLTDGIRMTYKTSPHAVISLGVTGASSGGNKNMQLMLPGIYPEELLYDDMQLVCPDGTDGFRSDVDLSSIISLAFKYYAVIGELYRPGVLNFGGYDDSALQSNRWLPCGPTILLDGGKDITVDYTYGDTFIQRYDHLRIYPFTRDDLNQNIEIASFLCATRINIDGRYDRNRGLPVNMSTDPTIFNLYNPVYSQKDNYFTAQYLDKGLLEIDSFPSSVLWTRTKTYGEDIDTWSNISMASTLDLDGDLGSLRALRTFNSEILAFQDNALAKILFNSRVQINASDQVPIEIANSGKVDGKVYLSRHTGTVNKFSIVSASAGLYFMDNNSTSIYLYNGQLNDISDTHGFKSWCSTNIRPDEYGKPLEEIFTSHYDKTNGDVYFNNNNWSLCYSQLLGQFMSFYSHEGIPHMFNMARDFLSVNNEGGTRIWKEHFGKPCHFYGIYRPFYTHIIANPEMTVDKVFDTLEFRSDSFTEEGALTEDTFDTLECWNEYQRGSSNLSFLRNKPSPLKRKFRVWRADIPRDSSNNLDRMRNTWLNIKLSKQSQNDYRTVLHDMTLHYTV